MIATEKHAIRVTGILLPSMLLLDDIVYMVTDIKVLQYILDTLSSFCAQNHLKVSLKRIEYLLGGHKQSEVTAELDTQEDLVLPTGGPHSKGLNRSGTWF